MRKIKVVIFLAIMILPVILLDTAAEEDNESDNLCPKSEWFPKLENKFSNLDVWVKITAKRAYNTTESAYQFPTFEQRNRLLLLLWKCITIIIAQCLISPFLSQ